MLDSEEQDLVAEDSPLHDLQEEEAPIEAAVELLKGFLTDNNGNEPVQNLFLPHLQTLSAKNSSLVWGLVQIAQEDAIRKHWNRLFQMAALMGQEEEIISSWTDYYADVLVTLFPHPLATG